MSQTETASTASVLRPKTPQRIPFAVRLDPDFIRQLKTLAKSRRQAPSTLGAHMIELGYQAYIDAPRPQKVQESLIELIQTLQQEVQELKSARKIAQRSQLDLLTAIYFAELSQTLSKKEAKEKAITQAKSMLRVLNPPSSEKPTKTPSPRRR